MPNLLLSQTSPAFAFSVYSPALCLRILQLLWPLQLCVIAGRYSAYISMPTPVKPRKSSTSSPVETASLPGEVTTVDVKSQKMRKRRKIEWGNASDGEVDWAKSLSESQLDLMASVKQLAMERVRSTREKSLNGLLTPAGLRAIGIILEEFMMDRVQTLRNAPAAPSSVIDDLRACIEKSEVETNETNQEKTATETDEGS